jgi:hypothetical protein
MTTREIRDRKIVQLRDDGHNLTVIAKSVGLTRERVRQILAEQGLRTMTYSERVNVAIAAWRASGELRRASDVAREHGLAMHSETIALLRRECGDLSLPEIKPVRGKWDLPAIARVVRRVAIEQGIDPATGWLKISQFAKWRREGDPSIATIGSNHAWLDVMEAAGFNAANAPARGRQLGYKPKAFTDAELDAAVQAYLDSHPRKLSAVGLGDFLADHPGMPSVATIRNRYRQQGINSISGILSAALSKRAA